MEVDDDIEANRSGVSKKKRKIRRAAGSQSNY